MAGRRKVLWGAAAVLGATLLVFAVVRTGAPGTTEASSPGAPTADARRCGAGPLLVLDQRIPGECRVQLLEETGGAGTTRTLADLQEAKPMVLNFWASWCTFCIREMPDFEAVYRSMEGRVAFLGLDLLGVQGETRRAAASFARESGVRYPLAYDRDGLLYFRLSPRLLMPTTVLVRADGTLAHRQFGPLDAEALRELISRHLGVRPATG